MAAIHPRLHAVTNPETVPGAGTDPSALVDSVQIDGRDRLHTIGGAEVLEGLGRCGL